jgi:dihydrofolate reductase
LQEDWVSQVSVKTTKDSDDARSDEVSPHVARGQVETVVSPPPKPDGTRALRIDTQSGVIERGRFDFGLAQETGPEQLSLLPPRAGASHSHNRRCDAPRPFAPVWRDSEDHAAYQDLPKYVVSTTLTDADLVDGWGPTTILRSSGDVAGLKGSEGGAILIHGSAELARRLSDADLIDRYNLLVFPLLLGAGKSLFSRSDRDKRRLRLRESDCYPNGVAKLVYDVVY